MKKKLCVIIILCLTFMVVFAACGGDSENGGGSSGMLTLATGGTGGTYYALGGAMATAWGNHDLSVSAVSSGASVENINLINSGEADLGLAMNSIADAAWNGVDAFEDSGGGQDFRAIGVVYPEVLQIVAASETGATTLTDLKGLTVALGPVGSGSAVAAEIFFSYAGMDTSKDISSQRDAFTDAVSKMQDGHLDASCAVLNVPASSIIELEISRSVNFINVPDDVLAAVQADYPYYTRYIIPAGTYSNTEDVNTVTCQAVLYCRADLDDDTVYALAKAFYESAPEIAAAHTAGETISLDNALVGITTPVHPGAAKYYEEMGMEVPSELIID